jgi:hypothetical protein
MRKIATREAYADYNEFLLKLYSGEPIAHRSTRKNVSVEDASICFWGSTVDQTFTTDIDTSMLVDGLLSRFLLVDARPDPRRTLVDHPVWGHRRPIWTRSLHRAWSDLLAVPRHRVYTTEGVFAASWPHRYRELRKAHPDLPDAFFHRTAWGCRSYALLYHLLLGKKSDVLDLEDLNWASRVADSHLRDLRLILDAFEGADEVQQIEKVQAFVARYRQKHNREPQPRDVVSGVKCIKSVDQAKQVLKQVLTSRSDPAEAPGAGDRSRR